MTNAQEPHTSTIAAQIEALAAKSTPGEWFASKPYGDQDEGLNCSIGGYPLRENKEAHYEDTILETWGINGNDPAANAALICFLRNNLPAIVTALRQAEAAPGVVEARNLNRLQEKLEGLLDAKAAAHAVVQALNSESDADTLFHVLMARNRASRALEDALTDDTVRMLIAPFAPPSADAAMVKEVAHLRGQVEAGRRFLDAANAAWAAGEPTHRVKTMLKRADEFRATLDLASRQPVGIVIDLDKEAWRSLCDAAAQSKWMPPEYMANDWLSDCRDFLINGPAAPATDEGDA